MLRDIRHLVGYDLRALRTPLAVWMLVLAAEAALLVAGPGRLGILTVTSGLAYSWGILVIRLALTAILVALVVQRDPLVGTTAFWRTRPIPRPGLLASKIVTVCLLVVLIPWLVMFGVLVGLGVPVPAAARGASTVAAEQAFVAVLALAAAALTASLAHFVIAGFAGLTLVLIFLAVLRAIAFRGGWVVEVAVGWASGVFAATAAAGAVAAAVHQFLTLRTGRSGAVVVGGLAVAIAGGALWHPMPIGRDTRTVDPAWLAPDTVAVRLDEVAWSSHRSFVSGVLTEERLLTAVLTAAGAPDGVLLTFDALDLSLHYGDRTITARGFHVLGPASTRRAARPADQPYRAVAAAIGGGELARQRNVVARDDRWATASTLGEDVVGGLTGGEGVLDGTVRLRAFRYVVTGRAPLSVGARLTTASQSSTITAIGPVAWIPRIQADSGGPGVDVTLRSTVVGPTPWARLPSPATGFLLLRNDARRQAVFLTPWGSSQITPVVGLVSMRISDVWTGTLRLEFDADQSEAPFAFDDDWLHGAELLLVEPEPLGVVSRRVHVEGVPAPSGTDR